MDDTRNQVYMGHAVYRQRFYRAMTRIGATAEQYDAVRKAARGMLDVETIVASRVNRRLHPSKMPVPCDLLDAVAVDFRTRITLAAATLDLARVLRGCHVGTARDRMRRAA